MERVNCLRTVVAPAEIAFPAMSLVEDFFFPVFTTVEEMGEYGNDFSKIQEHFLTAISLARNNEKKVTGIVINAFSEPLVIREELFDIIAEMDSAIEPKE